MKKVSALNIKAKCADRDFAAPISPGASARTPDNTAKRFLTMSYSFWQNTVSWHH